MEFIYFSRLVPSSSSYRSHHPQRASVGLGSGCLPASLGARSNLRITSSRHLTRKFGARYRAESRRFHLAVRDIRSWRSSGSADITNVVCAIERQGVGCRFPSHVAEFFIRTAPSISVV